MSIFYARLCDWAGCPSVEARGKAANILAVLTGLAIFFGLFNWLTTKKSH